MAVSAAEQAARGVVRFDRARASGGLSLYNSRSQSRALLIDAEGEVVHDWASEETGRTLREYRRVGRPPAYMLGWNHVSLGEDGSLLVIGSHHMLLSLDWDSRVRWKLDVAAHHDVARAPEGELYLLTDAPRSVVLGGRRRTVLDNRILRLGPDGTRKGSFSLLELLLADRTLAARLERAAGSLEAEQRGRLRELAEQGRDEEARIYGDLIAGRIDDEGIAAVLLHNGPADLLHANSVQVVPERAAAPIAPGGLVVCIRNLDLLVAIDLRADDRDAAPRIVWSWGPGELDRPHHASRVDDGNVLVFDNGPRRGFSRILEVDPRSGSIAFEYRADPPESFFSSSRGGCQKLPGGDYLITETNRGRAFEVTPSGRIVWEFFNPDVDEATHSRGAIYRMTRVARPRPFR